MKHIVCDTSYLAHLLDVDGRTTPAVRDRVRELFAQHADSGSVFYVPVPVIFELCNFIAQVASGESRRRLAMALRGAIEGSLLEAVPWTITPFEGDDSMRDWVEVISVALTRFSDEFAAQEIGLTDIAVIRCAEKLAAVVAGRPSPRPEVHIWTTDAQLKAREPNGEMRPYLAV